MPPLTDPLTGNVMIVDDNPANLKLLEDMLREHRYEVRSFPRGRLAIAAAEQHPPDLILLDINMPEMDGYQVCEQLKSSPRSAGIPVIFLSALNATEDKVKGFRSGGVDYISKPFVFEDVQARVETHLKLRRAQQAEHDLLEKTLGGAVRTLWELVQLTSPALASRSYALRDIVLWMTTRMELPDPWQYELAATLCLVGCVALPEEVFERAYLGKHLSPDEARMFHAHPARAARLLSNIPRLEVVAEIIRGQQAPEARPSVGEQAAQGARMLHLAVELDRRIHRGANPASALAELRASHRFDVPMLNALAGYAPTHAEYEIRKLPLSEIEEGMALDKDVLSKDGKLLILKGGTVLTETWIERLQNFARTRGIQELIEVRVPTLAAPEKGLFQCLEATS
jgi:DNA-binding response OmpR family regulator